MSPDFFRAVRSLASLTGAVAVACLGSAAVAGENIIFSAPSKALELPGAEHEEKDDSPKAPVSLGNFVPVETDMSMALQVTYIGPAKRSRNSTRLGDNRSDPSSRDDRRDFRDSNNSLAPESQADREVRDAFGGNSDQRSSYWDRDNPYDRTDNSASGRWPWSRAGMGGATNRFDLGRSWSSGSSKDQNRNKRDEYSAERSLHDTQLDAWHTRDNSEDQKDDTSSDSSWGRSSKSSSQRSIFARAIESRSSLLERFKGGADGRLRNDDGKSGFRWNDATTRSDSPASGSAEWYRGHDTHGGFDSSTAWGSQRELPFGAPKSDDSLGGMLRAPTGLQAPDLGGSGFSDLVPKQNFTPQAPMQTPMAPAVLGFPRKPWEH